MIFFHNLINGTIFRDGGRREKLLNIKYVFGFSGQFG
jgi:hypothetical protein